MPKEWSSEACRIVSAAVDYNAGCNSEFVEVKQVIYRVNIYVEFFFLM